MSIDAINSLSEAIKVFNNKDTSNEERRQIIAKFPDVVKYTSVDSTKYEISDEDFNLAKDDGTQMAKDATGHDGSKQSAIRVGIDAVGATAATVGAYGQKLTTNLGAKFANKIGVNTTGNVNNKNFLGKTGNAQSKGQNMSDIATIVIASAVALKYRLNKPNEDQYKAAMKLYDAEGGSGGLLLDNQQALGEAQQNMADAEEEFVELSEEAETTNDEANEQIDEDKTKFDFYRAQYNALKARAEAGETLTSDEKGLMKKLAPQMEQLGVGITETQEETSETVSGLSEDMAEYQDVFDESADAMAEVEGVTDFAEGFDSSTKTMATIEAVAQGLNGTSAGIAAGRLALKSGLGFWAVAPFVAAGAATAVSSAFAAGEQMTWAGRIGNEIDVREQTQDLNTETTDLYDDKLDTYAANVELVDDLELVVPDDMEVPEAPATTEGSDGNDAAGLGLGSGSNPAGTRGADDGDNGSGVTPNENNPSYVNKMGNGSDWSEVANGNIKRDNDNDIVTDTNGKVVLIRSYSDAITNVTGKKEGEFFSKDDIPQILAKVLGSPFDAKMIRDIRNGKKLDSEYAAKLMQTKTGEEKGSTTVDNTEKATALAKRVIDFYYPIFSQASEKGWVKG